MAGFYETDPATGEVTAAKDIPQEAVDLIEKMDDAAIVQSMTSGMGSDVFIYRYPIKTKEGSKEIIGISAEGSYELANKVRNMEVLSDYKIDKDNDPDYIFAVVRVKNLATNVVLLGVGRQCKYVVGGQNTPLRDRMDEHAFVKAVTKAQRNGILHHADQGVIAEIIAYWTKTGKSKQLSPPQTQTGNAQKPAPVPVKPQQQPQPAPVATPTPKPAPAPAAPPASATPSAAPAPTAQQQQTVAGDQVAMLAEQEAKLKRLCVLVHNKFLNDLGINQDKRKTIIQEQFKDRTPVPESLGDLSEKDLNQMLSVAETMILERSSKKPVAASTTGTAEEAQAGLIPPEQVAEPFVSPDEQKEMIGDLFAKLTLKTNLGMSVDEAKKFLTDRGYTKSIDIPKGTLKQMTAEADQLIAAKQTPTNF